VHVRYRRARWLGLALGALLVFPACSAQGGSEPGSVSTQYRQVISSSVPSSERPAAPSTGKPERNDLKRGRVTRSFKAGAVKVTVKCSFPPATSREVVCGFLVDVRGVVT
jgi:hypothetical protein